MIEGPIQKAAKIAFGLRSHGYKQVEAVRQALYDAMLPLTAETWDKVRAAYKALYPTGELRHFRVTDAALRYRAPPCLLRTITGKGFMRTIE